ncbi:prohibitin family protein [Pusillimonas minor]|uniref:Prohibitin family protein n=1 Tax=Pusillimonas minor TaxID=2697024 RepID=A0A842HL31_9BURK|nr:prohibitin family protein [Pusillimonas minor]MBC2768953.1 prohibitin family protein [Pusillimonas minor]
MNVKLRHLLRRLASTLIFLLLVAVFLIIILWDAVIQTTPVGHASVLWHRFPVGGQSSVGPLREGMHIIQPWDRFYTYDLRLQTKDQDFQVVSKDGLHFNISLTIRWRIIRHNLVLLNQTMGPNYVDKLLVPKVGWAARRVVANYSAEALFTDKRTEVQELLYKLITEGSPKNGIAGESPDMRDDEDVVELTDVLIRNVELPAQIKRAIENKLEQAQIVEEYRFIVQREVLESQRKEIEAEGIRKFQETIAPAISDSYLKWRGIEASLELAKSPNSKIVIFGNSESGLPVIFDATDKGQSPITIDTSSKSESPPAKAAKKLTPAAGAEKTADTAAAKGDPAAYPNLAEGMPPTPEAMRGYKDDGPNHRNPVARSR